MGTQYPVLRYPGNITGADGAQPGALLGHDEIGRPYEVIDAEYIDTPDGVGGYTNVFLQYATPETLKKATQL
jgi:hypothetical protein